MYPSTPFTYEQYLKERQHARDGGVGQVHLYDLPPDHPIYTSLPESPMVQHHYKRYVAAGLTSRPADAVLLSAMDLVAQGIGVVTFDRLAKISISQLAITSLAVVYSAEIQMEGAIPDADKVCIRHLFYGYVIAQFALMTMPSRCEELMRVLVNSIAAPHYAHEKALETFRALRGTKPMRLH